MTDGDILALYSQWSEEYYCAGFLNPDSVTVQEFRNWLKNPLRKDWSKVPTKDYEYEMLEEYRRQEAE